MPRSPCGAGCVDHRVRRVAPVVAAGRLAHACGVLLLVVLTAPATALLGRNAWLGFHRRFCAAMARALGVRIEVHGEAGPPDRGALMASNHVSWLDVLAVNAVLPTRGVAKSEIAGWWMIGRLVAGAGTIFVDRSALSTLPRTVAEVTAALRDGWPVSVFAEGTTRCGRRPGRFVPAPFQAAIDSGAAVRPLALRYRVAGAAETTYPAMVGDDSVVSSAWRIARLAGLVVEVRLGQEIAAGRLDDRRELAAHAEAAVHGALAAARADQAMTGDSPLSPRV
ncbi:1-acyl-sn-glycerol-3-phosphate acyltransferase [Haloechinothrix sp. YIM 98757]|uniref:1-acyl-sn-glycerol-3-phosphate acyltransferase n=2 Tax=Haloechinothrix aidingensis TaxID=2752311 RepID=A0A837ZWJ9_9PSEU|nr:lysophospholipid acyltransferase family protein [Haloechinothrix aidingensis]MBA0125016.1 1-acyl-sn-glycerol-3-phosphate acyltransferase [Haloechinothrix aidingensis]